MKRKLIVILILILLAFQINAEDIKIENKPSSKTEFGFKAMKFDFIPYEYSYLKIVCASKK
ncbi:hypothetical protein, partial [Leptospira terpstrae]|uniref:hypothetical protein n=1 Tax=Leptospira terpstrae TaxID=293075 RepID=UPI0005870199